MLPDDNRSAGPNRRLFFALWPDDAVRDRLGEVATQVREGLQARWVRRDHFHITLAFLGAIPEAHLPRLLGLELERPEAFDLVLDNVQFRQRRQMIWIAPAASPPALERLVEDLGPCLKRHSVAHDPRPFHAHLTLARSVRDILPRPVPFAPIIWTVSSFSLVESTLDRSGARYRVLHTWPLPVRAQARAMPNGAGVE